LISCARATRGRRRVGGGTGRPSFLLAEAARSECAPSMRAVKDSLTAPPLGKVGKRKALAWANGTSRRARGLGGWESRAQWESSRSPSLKRTQASGPPARGTRTIRMCSFDARNRGATKLPSCEKGRGEGEEQEQAGPSEWSLCSRNAPGLVCLVGRSFWSVWFFWMNFQSD
jgi:hypothetical protein